MGSRGDDNDNNGNQSHLRPLDRQNSLYALTMDEVQNQLGDLGKPLSSMNLDELLRNVWTVEGNPSTGIEVNGIQLANQAGMQRQASITLTDAFSKKTVDEVWRDIQQRRSNEGKKSHERQATFGEMTLEDFLVKAGIVVDAETSTSERQEGVTDAAVGTDIEAPQFKDQAELMQRYSNMQYYLQPGGPMGAYMPNQHIAQPIPIGAGLMDTYTQDNIPQSLPLVGTFSDSQMIARKGGVAEDMVEKTVERRQKRMIKNRESAARSRARKQAYTNELENKVSRLEEENKRLRKRKELEKILPCTPLPEPKYQLRRTSSSPL